MINKPGLVDKTFENKKAYGGQYGKILSYA
jgi:hypothetical protein